MPKNYRHPDSPDHVAADVPARAAGHSIVFDSPAELAAYTRHDRLSADGPLLLARRAGFHPDGPWPCSARPSDPRSGISRAIRAATRERPAASTKAARRS